MTALAEEGVSKVAQLVDAQAGQANWVEQEAARAAAAKMADEARKVGNKPAKAVRRGSTIAIEHYDMCLISAKHFIDLYGGEDAPRLDAWQVLKEKELLVQYADLPPGAKTYFISHEWHGFAHPDNSRIKTKTLIRTLQRLEAGEIPLVETFWQDQLNYSGKTETKASEWKGLLAKAYLWVDWCCMPQPGAEPKSAEGTEPTEAEIAKMQKLREDGGKAIRSIPAYIEMSDMVIIVAPPGTHEDREEDTCYRSWRSRGWCMMELFACLFSRQKDSPVMVVTSAEGTPYYINPGSALLYMSVDRANFSCCQRNHVPFNLTATQKILLGDKATIPCDKPVVMSILEPIIDAKIAHLHAEGNLKHARYYRALKGWVLRGLEEEKGGEEVCKAAKQDTAGGGKVRVVEEGGVLSQPDAVRALKEKLWWSDDGSDDKIAQETGWTLLWFAVMMDDAAAVEGLLEAADADGTLKEVLDLTVGGDTEVGRSSGQSVLYCAMAFASPAVVTLLLDAGADPLARTKNMFELTVLHGACGFGRLDNVEMWLARFKDWDVNTMDNGMGNVLAYAAYGLGDVPTMKRLIEAGADITALLKAGANPSLKTELGLDVVEFSKLWGPFPAVEAAIGEYCTEKI
eukprot:g1188.t1